MAHDHGHSHSHGGSKSCLRASKTCRLSAVLLITLGFFFVELVFGYTLHSVAIAADAIHMLSDSSALIIAMVSVRVGARHDEQIRVKRPSASFFFRFQNENRQRILLGKTRRFQNAEERRCPSAFSRSRWIRAQELGAMVNCILLMSLCFTILVQAIKRLISVETIDRERLKYYVMVGVIGLVINVMALAILGSKPHHFMLLIYDNWTKTTLFRWYGSWAFSWGWRS